MLRVVCPGVEAAHASPGHPERPDRVHAALAGLRGCGVASHEVEAAPADAARLLAVHTAAMVERGRTASGALDADTYVTPASWSAALRSAGASLEAARVAPAFAVARPPGHHATRERAMGFCLLNNVAIAAQAEAERGRRVAIVDVDVHHGNGTQDVFWTRGDVLYASLHEWPLYPGTGRRDETGAGDGAGKTVNVPLPAGTDDAAWLAAFDAHVLPAVEAHRPDLVLVSAGFDAHARDPLGHMLLTARAFHAAVDRLRRVQPRIAAVLEGGYDLRAIAACAAATGQALVGEPFSPSEGSVLP